MPKASGPLDPWAAYQKAGRLPGGGRKKVGSKAGVVVKRGAGGKIMGSIKRAYDPGAQAKVSGLSYSRIHTETGKNRQSKMVTVRGMDYNTPSGRPKERSIKVTRFQAAGEIVKARRAGTLSRRSWT